jgi:hypothetical protein
MSYAAETYPLLAKLAVKLLGMHVTKCAPERNWSQWGLVYTKSRNRLEVAKGEKIVYIRGNKQVGSSPNDFDACEQLNVAGKEEIEEIL